MGLFGGGGKKSGGGFSPTKDPRKYGEDTGGIGPGLPGTKSNNPFSKMGNWGKGEHKNQFGGEMEIPDFGGDIKSPVSRRMDALKADNLDAEDFDNRGELQRNAGLQSATNKRFDVLRSKAEEGANRRDTQAFEASQRGAAARGRLGSGSLQKQLLEQNRQLGSMRSGEIADVESQRDLSLAQQDEASAQRSFQAEEAWKQRELSKKMLNSENKFKAAAFNEQSAQFRDQMSFEAEKLNFDKKISQFNAEMSTRAFNTKDMSEWFANMWGFDPRTGSYNRNKAAGGTFKGGGESFAPPKSGLDF